MSFGLPDRSNSRIRHFPHCGHCHLLNDDRDMNVQSQENVGNLNVEIATTTLTSDLRQCAILLDIDGTILDIAPTPREVWVPPKLRQTLARLQDLTGGALALVSGRLLADIDLIFAPLQLAAVGGHGAELRSMPNAEPQRR